MALTKQGGSLTGMTDASEPDEDLGLGLEPGASQYRAYVGPPEDYDLIAAMTFSLLTTLGLRQHHTLIDVGCGSLRSGRLFIPYLNVGKYIGIEPNRWLVEEGIRREIGADMVRIKRPTFYYEATATGVAQSGVHADFAVAQSIFSHCGLDLFRDWLTGLVPVLAPTGALVATFLVSDHDHEGNGWVYPGTVAYTRATIQRLAEEAGLTFQILDWRHPRQTWGLFSREHFASSWINARDLSWSTRMRALLGPTPPKPVRSRNGWWPWRPRRR